MSIVFCPPTLTPISTCSQNYSEYILDIAYSEVQCITATCLVQTDLQDVTTSLSFTSSIYILSLMCKYVFLKTGSCCCLTIYIVFIRMASCDTKYFYDAQSSRPGTETVFHVFTNPLYSCWREAFEYYFKSVLQIEWWKSSIFFLRLSQFLILYTICA